MSITERVIEESAPVMEGVLFCRECGFKLISTQEKVSQWMKHGWPKHCSYTMTLITDKQLREV